jgi:hypothetical protein
MIRKLRFVPFAAVAVALVAAPAFGAKGGGGAGGNGTATIAFASAARTSVPSAGSQVSFAVTANVKPSAVYSLWVANVCSRDGVTVSAEYHPVQDWSAGPFALDASGVDCTAYVWMFPDAWTPLKGGSMSYSVG